MHTSGHGRALIFPPASGSLKNRLLGTFATAWCPNLTPSSAEIAVTTWARATPAASSFDEMDPLIVAARSRDYVVFRSIKGRANLYVERVG